MPCYHPLHGYRKRECNPSGKRGITFDPAHGFIDLRVTVPCGQCIGCRLERSRQWAMRCVHEASLHEKNCFVTLTYADDYLPGTSESGSLCKRDFQLFMKRLRKECGSGIRYFHCGEYGTVTKRPHYHACMFNHDFADKYQWSVRKGNPVYRSELLESLWPIGQSEIGGVSFESAAYVARYIVDKVTGDAAEEHYKGRQPEYTTMSKGIGKGWYEKYKSEVYPFDEVVVRGRAMKPPRFYDGLHELEAPDEHRKVKARRRREVHEEDQTPDRLCVRELNTLARLYMREDRSV